MAIAVSAPGEIPSPSLEGESEGGLPRGNEQKPLLAEVAPAIPEFLKLSSQERIRLQTARQTLATYIRDPLFPVGVDLTPGQLLTDSRSRLGAGRLAYVLGGLELMQELLPQFETAATWIGHQTETLATLQTRIQNTISAVTPELSPTVVSPAEAAGKLRTRLLLVTEVAQLSIALLQLGHQPGEETNIPVLDQGFVLEKRRSSRGKKPTETIPRTPLEQQCLDYLALPRLAEPSPWLVGFDSWRWAAQQPQPMKHTLSQPHRGRTKTLIAQAECLAECVRTLPHSFDGEPPLATGRNGRRAAQLELRQRLTSLLRRWQWYAETVWASDQDPDRENQSPLFAYPADMTRQVLSRYGQTDQAPLGAIRLRRYDLSLLAEQASLVNEFTTLTQLWLQYQGLDTLSVNAIR